MKYWLFFLLAAQALTGEEIEALYLSWYADPTSTITIQWHTDSEETGDAIQLQLPDGEWLAFEGSHQLFPHEFLQIHTLQIQDLDPDTLYHFRVGTNPKIYAFQTAPETLQKPLRFIIGGDLYLSLELFREMNKTVVKQDPLFAVLGGDLAYAIHNPFRFRSSAAHKWREFLADWTKELVTADGRLIPLLVVPGNHDIEPGNPADLFFSLFAFPERTLYRAVDFGNYLSLILLDTGYLSPVGGLQATWLSETLQERAHTPFCFSIYHEGAYPSFYPYNNSTAKQVRAEWCPLFDQYGVQAAFEHHGHTFKRTYPLKAGQIDPSGTIYFGDGCWGVPPRRPNDLWYLEKRARENNIYLIELTPGKASVKALSINGLVIDKTDLSPRQNNKHSLYQDK